jgi:hypothetical protein
MKVTFERAGGFAQPAMRRRCMVDSQHLAADEAGELHRLLAALPAQHVPAQPAGSAPDAFHYRIQVEDAGKTTNIEASDATLSEEARALVHWLLKRAKPG